MRAGQTEGSVDLARLAGLQPMAVLIEIMNEDGTMARVPDLVKFAKTHDIRMYTVADIIEHRMQREPFVTRGVTTRLPTRFGEFKLISYHSPVDPSRTWRCAAEAWASSTPPANPSCTKSPCWCASNRSA